MVQNQHLEEVEIRTLKNSIFSFAVVTFAHAKKCDIFQEKKQQH